MRRKHVIGALVIGALGLFGLQSANADAQVNNGGNLWLGVDELGQLNVADVLGVTVNVDTTGLTWSSVGDATSPGCLCEGWGVGGNGGAIDAYANNSLGISGLTVATPQTSDGVNTTTVADVTGAGGLTVTHAFSPAAAAPLNAYEAVVTISNNTGATISDLRYTRVMDWDVPPTEFAEFVTIGGWPASALLGTSDDGFDTGSPFESLDDLSACGINVNFTKCGVFDHGAHFNFGFGDLADGDDFSFSIFYGAADTEAEAFAVLTALGIEVFSIGYSSASGGGPNVDSPVFFFGFTGVGGTPIDGPPPADVPEPAPILLIGLGLLALAWNRKKQ